MVMIWASCWSAFSVRPKVVSARAGLKRWTTFLCIACAAFAATPAWAYVDPNAGGIIFQIAMPVLAIGGAAIALLKKRVSGLFRRLRPGDAVKVDSRAADE